MDQKIIKDKLNLRIEFKKLVLKKVKLQNNNQVNGEELIYR